MALLYSIGATVAGSTDPPAALVLGVYIEPSGGELALDITPHPAADHVFVRSGGRQAVRFELFAHIAPFATEVPVQSWEWSAEVGGGGRGSIAIPASRDDLIRGALEYETQFAGPPPGAAGVDFSLLYGDASDLRTPLALAAVSASSRRSYNLAGHTMSLEFLDYAGRSDGKRFDYSLPALHGKRPSEIIAELATLAGVPTDRIELPTFGPPLKKSFESLGTGWLGRARDLAASFGYAVDFDARGVLVAYPWPPSGEPEAILDLSSFAADPGFDADADASAPRCVKIFGSAPEFPGGDGIVSFPPEVVETIEPYAIPRGQFYQTSGPDALTPTGAGVGITAPYVIERIETYRTKIGACMLFEEVVTWRWGAPKAARYTRDADDPPGETHNANGVFIYDADAVAGDNAEAYAWSEFRFVVVSREITTWEYGGPNGELTRKVVARGGWYNRSTATAQKEVPDDLPLDYKIEGNGRSVLGLAEEFYEGSTLTAEFLSTPGAGGNIASEITVYESSGGYKTAETETARGFLALPGTIFLYSDGKTYAPGQTGDGASEEYRVSGAKRSTYLATGTTTSNSITESRGPAGEFLRSVKTEAESYLPAIEVCDPVLDAEKSSRPFDAEVCAAGTTSGFGEEITNDHVEDESQARDLAGWTLRRLRALPVSVVVPAWGAARPGARVAIQMPRVGYPGLYGWIHSVKHSKGDAQSATITALELRIEA